VVGLTRWMWRAGRFARGSERAASASDPP